MIKTLTVGSYKFIIDPEDGILVEYSDGKVIDLKKLNITNIGIMSNDSKFTVTLITKESLQKIGSGLTQDLEIVGFHFNELGEALAIQNAIAINILAKGEK